MSIEYSPPATVERMMLDDTSLVRVLVGPVGSGKSMGAIMEILRRSRQQAPHADGCRYTRFAIVRNTLQQLRTTVLTDIQQYLGPMISYFVTDSTIRIRAKLPDGTTVVSDWLMIPLDTADDQKRLLSMQLTGAWINECREVPIEIVSALLGRLGRYPSKIMGGPSWFGLIADSNPWDTDSPYHERLVLDPLPGWTLYHQPSGIGPAAENTENLPPNYYENLANGRDDDWSAVHVESQWGTSNAGQAVFRRSFHVPTHVLDLKRIVNPFRPIMVAMDFGRTPAALIGQVSVNGQAQIFEEITTEDMGLIQMVEELLKPVLFGEPYAGKRVFVVADPAGRQKSQLTEESNFDVLKELGLLAYPASTNNLSPRLQAVEKLLRSTIMGEPALQISRTGCPKLIRALGNKYRYRRKRTGDIEDTPEKSHPWSDVADALQYFCLGANANLTGRVLLRDRPRNVNRERVSSAGWT
jgi:hypothetical protein